MIKLTKALEDLHISDIEKKEEILLAYMEGILSWNEKINLTAIRDREEFITKHLIDSLLCYNLEEYRKAEKIIDVGTGAGFPGVPLAVVSPEKHFLLADSLNKRLKVIRQLTEELEIRNAEVVHGRAEELARSKAYRQHFDLCVCRAVSNMSVVAEYCLPFIRKGGALLAYKGPDVKEELETARSAVEILGGSLERVQPADLEGFDHNIVVIKKVEDTPAKYPRKAGIPVKEPIF